MLVSKEARKYIIDRLRSSGEMTKSEIADLIRPHFIFDAVTAREQAVNRYVGKLVAQMKDEQGVRDNFIIKNQDVVVNLENCTSLQNITAVKEQLRKQAIGTIASYRKAKRRQAALIGQISLFEDKSA